jgi:hypothetical protein
MEQINGVEFVEALDLSGENIRTGIVGDYLVIAVHLGAEVYPSSTGKMVMVASSGGYAPVIGARPWKYNLTVGKPAGK